MSLPQSYLLELAAVRFLPHKILVHVIYRLDYAKTFKCASILKQIVSKDLEPESQSLKENRTTIFYSEQNPSQFYRLKTIISLLFN